MTEERYKQAAVGAWIGIAGNLALALLKGVTGYLANSKALMADAFHSASDVVGSVAVLAGLRAAKRPPDEDHPYGHGKAEPIAAIILSVLLLVVGVEIGISAAKSIYGGVHEPPEGFALTVLILSIIVKEAMFQYKFRLGKKLASQALIANAWEHRSDVYSSIAAFVGVGGAMLGSYFGTPYLYYLDPIAGLVVAVMVLRMGYRLLMDSVHSTMDHVLHQEDAADLLETVQRIKGVIAVDQLRAREHGHYVIVDVKISVNPRISIQEGHDIAKIVKYTLMKRFLHVSDVFVHVNPYDAGYPYKSADSEPDDMPTVLH
ncbi:cation diffusion facilitator family transporter [Paenibacillus sp. MZ04-78.2]|uniref:cation diffusion facilitator family transporter n=1 Tax=Paenibacillus sp. MZ04-78.2 TaxID=2962034 RepID=UPI0020B8A772|nr:cation diffusion facilitator family transporter [Paenibacillus sp. MZ04-78.2]MCP3773953.1 cation diffusion facilitator family transporter [Paenibacillus sp. MZ04-78.2]